VVASICSLNRFISEKYKTGKLFQLHFLQNSPFVQIYTCVKGSKGVGNIPGSHFVKELSTVRSILNYVSSITKAPSLQCWFQSTEKVKISCSKVRRL